MKELTDDEDVNTSRSREDGVESSDDRRQKSMSVTRILVEEAKIARKKRMDERNRIV